MRVWGSGGTVAQGRFLRICWVEALGVRVSVRRAPLDEQAELEALLLHAGMAVSFARWEVVETS